MSVKMECGEHAVTAYLSGEIDHHCAKEMRDEIDGACDRIKPQMLILDFRDVTFMDSSGIGLVMGRYKLMQQFAGEIVISNANTHIQKVMKLAGLDRLAVIEKGAKR